VARWLRRGLESTGSYSVDIHDLATSYQDALSRRLASPNTWIRRSLRLPSDTDSGVYHWGANAVEVEFMRYRPRVELTKTLSSYDLIQVVTGGPALAAAVVKAETPVALQVATTAAWERRPQLAGQVTAKRAWRQGMTALTTRVERSALSDVDVVLVENQAMLEHVRILGQPHVIKAPPGVDTDRFVPGTSGWRRDGYLLSVCRLGDARKGLNRAVLAYSKMLRSDTGIPDLILAGRGELAPQTAECIRQLGLTSRVQVRSEVGVSELISLYQGASVFLLTSHEEGLGISVLEAMACGIPVICTETAGTRETVDSGVTGWLVAQSQCSDHVVAGEVAERALTALSGEGDSMGARGRDRCLRMFSLGVTLRRFTDAYDDLAI
jgi:glycosyltransferase involved in cell wall biosynthesis